MDSSLLYHAWGLRGYKCTRTEYKDNNIILHVEAKKRPRVCPKCGCNHLVKNGYRIRDFWGLPIGAKKVIIRMKVQRYKCKNKDCDYDQQEKIRFARGSCSYTRRFANYVISLLKDMTLKTTAELLGVSWDTIKDIHVRYLKNKYSPPSLKGVDCIGIDEFAVKKGYVYKTIVVDLKSGRIIYVGNGKGADALKGFWKRVKRNRIDIKYIATDFSSAYTSSIFEISVRRARCLPLTSFRFHLAMDTLVSLAGQFPLLGSVRDSHPLADIHASQTKQSSRDMRFVPG